MLLRDKDRQILFQIFTVLDQPVEILAFGSRVNGTAHEGSDLDLVIRTKDESVLPPGYLIQVRNKIQESNIPFLVEVFDWKMLPESFRANIAKHHELLFSTKSDKKI